MDVRVTTAVRVSTAGTEIAECGRLVEATDPATLRRIAAALDLPDTADDMDALQAILAMDETIEALRADLGKRRLN